MGVERVSVWLFDSTGTKLNAMTYLSGILTNIAQELNWQWQDIRFIFKL
jgi:hypothetical protein